MHEPLASEPPSPPLAALLSVDGAARSLSVSRRTIQTLIAKGQLSVVRIGRRVAVDPRDLRLFVDSRRRRGGADEATPDRQARSS